MRPSMRPAKVIGWRGVAGGGMVLAWTILTAALVLAGEPAGHDHKSGSGTQAPLVSPYAGKEDARVSGLLAEEVEGLTKGSGMAMALAAELNGYPGPRHVLDAADAGHLALRPEQREAVQRLYDRMLAEAKGKGREILQAEEHLAMRFRHAHVDEAVLREALERIGRLRADLRFVHLRTHLETKALLTPEQIARYNAVRGYDAPGGGHKH